MFGSAASQPFVVNRVTQRPLGLTRSLGYFEVRPCGLRIAAAFLGAHVENLDSVRDVHARADLAACPLCRQDAA